MAQRKRVPGHTLTFYIITAVPNGLVSYLGESLLKRAREKGIVSVNLVNLRRFSLSRHKKTRPTRPNDLSGRAKRWSFGRVDDRPFGGGPGMVIQIQPVYDAVAFVKSKLQNTKHKRHARTRTILFSTRGKKLDAKTAKRLSRYDMLILICGRYEGVDERVQEHIADEEISIGDYVLSGGELPALVMIEAVSRFIPGFLGKRESLEEVKGSYPAYTRPAHFKPKGAKRAWSVPPVLLSGDHKKIEQWRGRM